MFMPFARLNKNVVVVVVVVMVEGLPVALLTIILRAKTEGKKSETR